MKRILIVEDNMIIVNTYRNLLQVAGFEVEVTANGIDGLKATLEHAPDLVLLDVQLPGLNGWEVLQRIRAGEPANSVPVIILTESSAPAQVEQAWRLGATEVLSKTTVKPKEVVEVVKRLASQASAPEPVASVQ